MLLLLIIVIIIILRQIPIFQFTRIYVQIVSTKSNSVSVDGWRDLNTSLKLKHPKNYSSTLLENLFLPLMAAAPHLCSALFSDQAFFSFFDVLMDLNKVYIYRHALPLLRAAKWGRGRREEFT